VRGAERRERLVRGRESVLMEEAHRDTCMRKSGLMYLQLLDSCSAAGAGASRHQAQTSDRITFKTRSLAGEGTQAD
jgi:hypothetical protein